MRLTACRVGQRVAMSEAGRKVWRTVKRAGVIVRVRKTMIVVKRDGVQSPEQWLPVYWELEGAWSDGTQEESGSRGAAGSPGLPGAGAGTDDGE